MKRDTSDEAMARQRMRHAEAVRRYREKRERTLRERAAKGERIGLPPVNKERRAKREAVGEVYGPYYRWVRDECTDPCVLRGGDGGHRCGFFAERPKMEAHHVKTVGSGGKDAGNLVRACPHAHDLTHTNPPSYAMTEHGVDMGAAARRLWDYYQSEVV